MTAAPSVPASSSPVSAPAPVSGAASDSAARSDGEVALLHWLARCTGFPASRLTAQAELLLLFASAAAEEAAALAKARGPRPFVVRDAAQAATDRQWAQRRNQVHFKCDNSAKV